MPGSGVELPDLEGSTGQVGVIEPQGHNVFFRLCEEPAEPQRFFEELEGDVERLLPLLDPKRYLPAAQAWTDVIVAARAEWIKAERLLPLAGDGNDDRGPFDAVRLPAEQLPVGVKHYVQMRPGTDLVPSGAVLGHGLLHPLWLRLFRHLHVSSHQMHVRPEACNTPSPEFPFRGNNES